MSHLGSHRYQAAEDRFEPTSVSESETHAQHRDFNLLPHTVSARGVGGSQASSHGEGAPAHGPAESPHVSARGDAWARGGSELG